jgi:arylsulfatase A-like enzyme
MSNVNNVLIVVVDALRADRVNENNNLTPNIDALAEDGVQFTNAFTCINTTDPAITSLQTGRYPLSHGVLNHGWHVTDSEKARVEQVPKLPEILDRNGFNTISTGRNKGRWHKSGFDVVEEAGREAREFKTSKRRVERRIGDLLAGVSPGLYEEVRKLYTKYVNETITRLFSDDLKGNKSTFSAVDTFVDNATEPFYGFIHLMDTHTPYTPPDELVEECLKTRTYDELGTSAYDADVRNPWLTGCVDDWEVDDIGEITARYDGAVKHADRQIGRLLNWLDDEGLRDDTLVVVLADHGELLGEHGVYFDHHCLYDPAIRIPLVVHAPDIDPATVEKFVQITDIMPTVLDYLSFGKEADADGRSLRPLMTGNPDSWDARDFVIAEEANTQRKRTIRTSEYKLITTIGKNAPCRYCETVHAKATELYELAGDPDETDNVAAENPDLVDDLSEALEEVASEFETPDVDNLGDIKYEDEEELEEQLRALGYR